MSAKHEVRYPSNAIIKVILSCHGNKVSKTASTTRYYHSFRGPNVCLARLQIELCRAANYLQPAKIKSQHFGVSLKFLVCN